MTRQALVCLMVILTPLMAAEQVVIVRDDDGSDDEGRAQVTSHLSVLRKTLLLDREPADLTRAWVMYYMKVRPYDVATRKLYDKPEPGVEWANLVIAVNGTEILRGSLIEHGTMGWHEVAFDPKLLRRGENQVTMTLDKPGSYFYLGIDRTAPQGRSAGSRDAGKTFRDNWLSFGTEQPDPGEYMIRLKVAAPAAEEVGFTERDGRWYGWLEVEDLFSKTTAHASGFKAIEWTKGVNQPSGGLVAWGPVGRFSIPLELPADRDWRIWVRCWMDGFRNGAFRLSADSRPVYDSAGKHTFTSDSQLRFDWLDCGTVHLGDGHHTIELATAGDCGHMFDTLVLTTDTGYVPDERQPLPRMTRLARLMGPEGVTRPEPGPYLTADPVPWGKPLAGAPLRTLWVCGDVNEREVIELQRRLDLEAEVVSSSVGYYGRSVFGQDLSLDQAEALYAAVTGKPYDVVVLVRTKLDQLPEHVVGALLDKVSAGMGLIVCDSAREGEAATALTPVLAQVKPLPVPAFAAPVDLRRLASVRRCDQGRGRVLRVPNTLYGTMDRTDEAPHELRYPYWEYEFGWWTKLLRAAAGRDGVGIATVAGPKIAAPGETPRLTVTAGGGARLDGWWWPPSGAKQALAAAVAGGQATVSLPASQQDGLHRVALRLLDSDGRVLDWAAAHYSIALPVRATALEAGCTAAGDAVELHLELANTAGAARRTAAVEVYGAHQRLLGRVEEAWDVAPGAAKRTVKVPLVPSFERLIEARVQLTADGGRQELARRLMRPQPVVLDDYIPYCGLWENREAPCYSREVYARIYEDLGLRAVGPSGMVWQSLDQGFATALPFRLTDVGSATVNAAAERQPCLHDEAMWAKEEPAIRDTVRRYLKASPLVLGLGDEMQIGDKEACFSPPTLAAYRRDLQGRYRTVAELNRVWQTDFRDWEQVVPWRLEQARRRPDNLAPWLDFREFMTRTFTDTVAKMQGWVKEEAPNVPAGGINPWDESWTTCIALSKLFPVLEYGQIYPRAHDRGRCWFQNPRLIGMWSGYGRPRDQVEREGWLLPTYGGTLMCWYGVGRELGYGTLTGTLNLGDRAKWIRDLNRELTSGVGKLLIDCRPVPERVAIVHSYRSRFAYTALRAAEQPERVALGWDQEYNELEEQFVRLLRRLRVPYRFVDEDQLEAGVLADCGLVIAPHALALSERAVARLKEAAGRCPVVVTALTGRYDEVGRRRTESGTALIAGQAVDWPVQPLPVSDDSLARLRAIVAGAGVPSFEQAVTGNIDFVVHRRLVEADVLVVFGHGELKVAWPTPVRLYDARRHREVGSGTSFTITQERSPAVLVLSPTAPAAPGVTATAAPGAVSWQVTGGGATTVARVQVIGPDGVERPWYCRNVLLAGPPAQGQFVPALNDPAGAWLVRATDVLSGAVAEARVEVQR